MTVPDLLADEVRAWIGADPDPVTRAELTALLDRAEGAGPSAEEARADLADRFSGPLEFGTAGLRGALGAGPRRMNRAVVLRATAGLCAHLVELAGPGFAVVVGHDARHGSARFARDAAATITAAGGRALVLDGPSPTPLAAFALRHLEADAAVVVTASHNPPGDNGYKVYLGGRAVDGPGRGAQIVPPHDREIAARITLAPPAAEVPVAEGWEVLGDEVRQAYLDRVAALVPGPPASAPRIVLTSLHGVGGGLAREALRRAGLAEVHPVPEQAEPHPDFPTLAFPNPEEDGALDLALGLAAEVEADLVLAHDPDADRCSAAVPDPAGGWRRLSGDEIGALLGEQAARRAARDGRRGAVLASSVVSSRMLARIAAGHGLEHRTTLTGFKWIARADEAGGELVYGYEEAIGYCVDPGAVRDKDGIAAAVLLGRLAAEEQGRGRSLLDALDDLAAAHGAHRTAQVALRVNDLAVIAAIMRRLRSDPPRELGGSAVTAVEDLATGAGGLPPTDGLILRTRDGDRVVIRPSGTEPKLKCYLEAIEPVAGRSAVAAARARAAGRLSVLREEVARLIGA